MLNNEPCPTCGAEQCKRWQMLSGQWVCDECWLDVAMDIQHHHFKIAERDMKKNSGLHYPLVNRRARSTSRAGSVQLQTTSTLSAWRSTSVDKGVMESRSSRFRPPLTGALRKSLDTLVQPGYNSVCLLCSHIFYGAAMSSCSRCGGLCQLRTDHDLQLQQRRATQLIEAEK